MKATIKSRPSVLKRKNDTLLQIRQKAADLAEITVTEEQARELVGPVGYTARFMVQTSMPYLDPGEISVWARENGRATLTIQPWLEPQWRDGRRVIVNHGVPSGAIPRLIMAYIGTQVVLTGRPVIDLGDSMSEFLRILGYTPTWGRGKTNDRLAEQIFRLLTCKISYVQRPGDEGRPQPLLPSYKNLELVSSIDNFWVQLRSREGQRGFWNATLTLTPPAFQAFHEDAVPLNMLSLRRFKKSPLEIDVYTWLAPRLFRLRGCQDISYDALARQFGSQYATIYDFVRYFDNALIEVCREYTAAKVEFISGGIRLFHSRPHVKPTKDTNDTPLLAD